LIKIAKAKSISRVLVAKKVIKQPAREASGIRKGRFKGGNGS